MLDTAIKWPMANTAKYKFLSSMALSSYDPVAKRSLRELRSRMDKVIRLLWPTRLVDPEFRALATASLNRVER